MTDHILGALMLTALMAVTAFFVVMIVAPQTGVAQFLTFL